MAVKLGIVGFGEFSESFLDLFLTHPDIEKVVGCELVKERRDHIAKDFGIKMYASYDEMLESDEELDSIAIFTQRHQHGPMIIKALEHGKNVFSAVPIGINVEEIKEIIALVEKTRLIYMAAETCYYFPCAIYCREKYKSGDFGKFVFGEAQYYHDITEMFDSFSGSGDPSWKKVAGIPPMYYPTHSMTMLFSAVNEYPTQVSCLGFRDDIGDEIYGEGCNNWDNPFSNETAIFRMSGGGVARINEFRRVGAGKPSSFITGIYGTKGCYQCSGMHHVFQHGPVFGQSASMEDVSSLINSQKYEQNKDKLDMTVDPMLYKYHRGYSKVHPIERLPVAHRDIPDGGHSGSHAFLVDDFVRAVMTGKLPPNNAWDAANSMVPGIIAHESALQNGKLLDIPYMGKAPEDWEMIDYNDRIYE